MAALMSPSTDAKLRLKLADFSVLSGDGGSVGFSYGVDFPVLVGKSNGEFYALRGQCPHSSGTVIPLNGSFFCTNHGSVFDLEGIAFSGPAVGTQLPQYTHNYYETDGVLEIVVPNLAHKVTVVDRSGLDRVAMTFETVAGVKYEVRFRNQVSGTETVVPFATTSTGPLTTTEVTGQGTVKTVYVARTGSAGFFVVNAKVTRL